MTMWLPVFFALINAAPPQCVAAPPDKSAAQASRCFCGAEHTCQPIRQVTATGTEWAPCLLLGDGSVQCFSDKKFGGLQVPTPVPGLSKVRKLAGAFASCALLQDGTAACWGSSESPVFGDGDTSVPSGVERTRHSPVSVLELRDIVDLDTNGGHACAVLANGQVFCWGANQRAEAGVAPSFGVATPTQVPGVDATQVRVGGFHSCALRRDGTVACWGRSYSNDAPESAEPKVIEGLAHITELSLAADFGCARDTSGRVLCWGANDFGQLGDGTRTARSTARLVRGLPSKVSAIRAANQSVCAIDASGGLWCWGINSVWPTSRPNGLVAPARLKNMPAVVDVAFNDKVLCGLRAEGDAVCLGEQIGLEPRRPNDFNFSSRFHLP